MQFFILYVCENFSLGAKSGHDEMASAANTSFLSNYFCETTKCKLFVLRFQKYITCMCVGILVEGIGCVLAGMWGTGSGTTSYSENVGAIGVTKVTDHLFLC